MSRSQRVEVLQSTTKGRSFVAPTWKASKATKPPAAAGLLTLPASELGGANEEDNAEHDAYRVFDEVSHPSRLRVDLNSGDNEVQYRATFEDERGLGEVPIEKRINLVTSPPVVARSEGPGRFCCHCCGEGQGFDVQLPLNVFSVAWRSKKGGGGAAIACLKEMARLLIAGDFATVYSKTACCKKVDCLLAQDLMSADDYCAWMESKQRPQQERGTLRKDQGLVFSENVILLRILAVQRPPVFSDAELRALFEFVVLNSQFIQEREKRFIATAMSAVENTHLFPFTFARPQSVVDTMAQIPRNYASSVILPLIMDKDLNAFRWQAKGNKILETALPKAPDALFAIMCDQNAANNGYRKVNGRIAHTVPPGTPYAHLFTPQGFKQALWWACGGHKPRKYALRFASAERDYRHTSAYTGSHTHREMSLLISLLSGTKRGTFTTGTGHASAPTCGSLQANSGVHTRDRYIGAFLGQGFTMEQAEEKANIFIDSYPSGNTVGFEKLQGKNCHLSKACDVIREVEFVAPRAPAYRNPTRADKDQPGATTDEANLVRVQRRGQAVGLGDKKQKRREREKLLDAARKKVAMEREEAEERRQARIDAQQIA